jgi:hypothetical protein
MGDDAKTKVVMIEDQILHVMGFKPEIRRQFLQHFAKNGDLLAKHRTLIENQIRISKNKTKDGFAYCIKKSLWRNYATAKTAQKNPNAITAGGGPRIRACKGLADLLSNTGAFAKLNNETAQVLRSESQALQSVDGIVKEFPYLTPRLHS